MIRRFQGKENRNNVISALRNQMVVCHNAAIAKKMAECVSLEGYKKGKRLISQNAADNDLFFLLAGRVAIMVHRVIVAFREANTHVGEMALIDPSAKRSASVVAEEETVVARITERNFKRIAKQYPQIWRQLAVELGRRLRNRNKFVRESNTRPILFIGSSKESKPIAQTLIKGIDTTKVTVLPWYKDVFRPSRSTIEELENQLKIVDFAVLLFGPDDVITSRNKSMRGPRDNVLLEFGLFMGAIGRKRTYFLMPKGKNPVKIPSDLFGLTPIKFKYVKKGKKVDVASASAEIMKCIKEMGVR